MPLVVTSLELQKLCPHTLFCTLQKYTSPIDQVCIKYQINSRVRLAAFLAQISYESMYFNAVTENLNYTADQLQKTWPKIFTTDAIANQYAHQPQKIANKAYALKGGNGNEASGDGWTYRGSGLIQITGKYNYQQVAKEFNLNLPDVQAWLVTPLGATMSAGWFWNTNHLNTYADANKFTKITQTINGGQNGASDRLDLYSAALKLF